MKRFRVKQKWLLLLCVILAVSGPVPARAAEPPALHEKAREMAGAYPDTVGWLQVPGTGIDEAVLQRADENDNNNYYLRRNYKGEFDFRGSYFTDFRCDFSDANNISNISVYGNSMEDDPDGERFGQLNRYRSEDFLRENPILYFATADETSAYQIFAVSLMDASVPYNRPDLTEREFLDMLSRVRAASLTPLDDISVGAGDRLLTLIAPDYSRGAQAFLLDGARLVIMARRIEPETAPSPAAAYHPQTGV